MKKMAEDIGEAMNKASKAMKGFGLPEPKATPEQPYKFIPHNHKGLVEFSIGQEVWLIHDGHIIKTAIVGVYFEKSDLNPETRTVKYELLGMAQGFTNSQLCHSLSDLVDNFSIDYTKDGE